MQSFGRKPPEAQNCAEVARYNRRVSNASLSFTGRRAEKLILTAAFLADFCQSRWAATSRLLPAMKVPKRFITASHLRLQSQRRF
ncbi:hypothetical protein EMIT0P74_300004 [Pseudomonas sp. IT-P74]